MKIDFKIDPAWSAQLMSLKLQIAQLQQTSDMICRTLLIAAKVPETNYVLSGDCLSLFGEVPDAPEIKSKPTEEIQ